MNPENPKVATRELLIQLVQNPSMPFVRADYFQATALNGSIYSISGYQLDYHVAAAKTALGEEAVDNRIDANQIAKIVTDLDGFKRLRDLLNQLYEQTCQK